VQIWDAHSGPPYFPYEKSTPHLKGKINKGKTLNGKPKNGKINMGK